ncbi:hypothetical protein IT087_02045 [Candidatus Uhrbacteria bacterium]|nr:hypothetical protein [Candidatus Uhrbacteria bacterium]
MSRIVLIHGFATGIGFSIFRPAYGADAGFSAFKSDIVSGVAKAFRWDIKGQASFFQSLNPFYTWDIYRRERKIAEDPETYRKLAEFLSHEQPETIICHSMGCFLFLEYLKHQSLPASVRNVVFNQADLPSSGVSLPSEIEERIRSRRLTITNTYCVWDVTLWCAVLIGSSLRAGLVGLRNPFVRNAFFPLVRPINLHTAAIRSPRFRAFQMD